MLNGRLALLAGRFHRRGTKRSHNRRQTNQPEKLINRKHPYRSPTINLPERRLVGGLFGSLFAGQNLIGHYCRRYRQQRQNRNDD